MCSPLWRRVSPVAATRARPSAPEQTGNAGTQYKHVWPLITEEGTFKRFMAEAERALAAAKEPLHRSRLTTLLAKIYAKRGDRERAVAWSVKAVGLAARQGQAAFDDALGAAKQACGPLNGEYS